MGNIPLRGLVNHHGRRIKIMKADGTMMKLRGPVSVEEILINYPGHGIFEAPADPRHGIASFNRPVPERAELVAGHLYYLIPPPLPQDEHINYNKNSKRGAFSRTSSHHSVSGRSSSRIHPQSSADIAGTDSIKLQEEADNKINRDGVTIVSSSYSTDGSTLRVKVRLRKEELASFLSATNVNVVVAPLIQGATRQSALLPWKPSLDTIAELHSPHGDL